jgi:hypothetical protein
MIRTWCDIHEGWVDEVTVRASGLGKGHWCESCRARARVGKARVSRRCGVCGRVAEVRKDGSLIAHTRRARGRELRCDGASQAILL